MITWYPINTNIIQIKLDYVKYLPFRNIIYLKKCRCKSQQDLNSSSGSLGLYNTRKYRSICNFKDVLLRAKKVGHQISVSFEKFDVVQALLSFFLTLFQLTV
jgi:hypothetical protein